MEELDNLKTKSTWGGRRDGAGRPEGSKNEETLEKERVLREVKQRIMRKAQRLIDSQFSIAEGQQFLYRIDTTIDEKGKKTKSKPILVTDPEEISNYLDGEYGDGQTMNTDTEYYFITTKEPINQAIDSMLDRTFDKAKQSVSSEVSGSLTIQISEDIAKKYDITPSSEGNS